MAATAYFYQAKVAFEENLKLLKTSQADPLAWNLNMGLLSIAKDT